MRIGSFFLLICITFLGFGCGNNIFQSQPSTAMGLREVPAVRLNFRYEGDVPAPTLDAARTGEERNEAIQADFDNTRPLEILDRTLAAPNKKHVVAIYHRVTDMQAEYRLDMYLADGKVLKKLTSDSMAVHFPDTIVWSPDSNSLAFVAMTRGGLGAVPGASPSASPAANTATSPATNAASNTAAVESNSDTETNANTAPDATPATAPTPPAPTGILTFRTEQIYICNADGSGVKPITENEGLIYFYYAWSPDSTMLAALAATSREWRYLDISAASKGESLIPQGRPRIIEKNGRERRLDDNLTAVRPVWSPDSAKVAAAFGSQIRLYDANGTNPTQAAIPLRNQLLISSQAYDREQTRQTQAANTDPNAPPAANTEQPLSTLPDEKLLVSFNPIVELAWTAEDLLYLKTAYIRRMQNAADSVMSFARWHRLALTTQAAGPAR
ncbi:MAG: hypothetical protein ABL952_03920 [Pyrinomonadaceae bacterium]